MQEVDALLQKSTLLQMTHRQMLQEVKSGTSTVRAYTLRLEKPNTWTMVEAGNNFPAIGAISGTKTARISHLPGTKAAHIS